MLVFQHDNIYSGQHLGFTVDYTQCFTAMKNLLILLLGCTLAPVYGSTPEAPAAITQQCKNEASALFESIQTTLHEEIQNCIKIGELSEKEVPVVQEHIDAYLQAARKAYSAQLAFALYSLSPLLQQDEKLYHKTLSAFQKLLIECYTADFEVIAQNSVIVSNGEYCNRVEANRFADAISVRGGHWDSFGRGGLNAYAQAREFQIKQFELKRQYLYALLAPNDAEGIDPDIITDATNGSWLSSYEFLSCTPLRTVPNNYQTERATLFIEAEKCWEEYTHSAKRMQAPLPRYHGTGTGQFQDIIRMKLVALHEQIYFTRIMATLAGN